MREILTPHQQRAAALLGRGVRRRDVAREFGVAERTITRWRALPEFERAVRKAREELLDENPDARSVLQAALNATRRDGSPDWRTRLRAAALLLEAPPEPASQGAEPTVITIYRDRPRDDDADD